MNSELIMKKVKVFYKYLCINHYDALASRRLMSTNSALSTTQSTFQFFKNSCSLTLHHHVFRFLLCHILFYFVILGFHACRWVLLPHIAVFPASFSAPPVSNQLFTLPNIYTLPFPSVSCQIVFVLQVGKLSWDFLMICLQDDIYCVFQRFFSPLVFWLRVSHYSLYDFRLFVGIQLFVYLQSRTLSNRLLSFYILCLAGKLKIWHRIKMKISQCSSNAISMFWWMCHVHKQNINACGEQASHCHISVLSRLKFCDAKKEKRNPDSKYF